MKACLLALFLVAAPPALAQTAPPSASELALAGRLVDAMGGVEAAKIGMTALGPDMLAGYEAQGLTPEMAKAFVEELAAEFDAHEAEFKSAMAAVWAKHFTEAEIRDLLGFMQTPTGRAYVGRMKPLTEDAAAVGRVLGERLAPAAAERLLRRARPTPPQT